MRAAAWMFGAAGWAATGCLLDTTGRGGASDGTPGTSSGGSTTTLLTSSTTTRGETTTGETTSTTTTSATVATNTSSAGDRAQLVFEEGESVDFGEVDITGTTFTQVIVSNEGTATASDIRADLAGGFAFTGGAYPGIGGDCTDGLGPGQTCRLVVEFAPEAFGPADSSLALDYDDGQGGAKAELTLSGIGVGTLDGLLVNPGGEMVGMPPPGWTLVEGGWQTTTFLSFAGNRSINAGNVNNQPGVYRLRQPVDVTEHAGAIDDVRGLLVEFTGQARSLTVGDDPFSIALRMLDDQGSLLDEQIGSDDSDQMWTMLGLSSVAAPGTRVVEVELRCEQFNGDFCSAFFDELELTLTFPAP